MAPAVKHRLLEGLRRLGGYPERCGICVAALDAVSAGSAARFRPGTMICVTHTI